MLASDALVRRDQDGRVVRHREPRRLRDPRRPRARRCRGSSACRASTIASSFRVSSGEQTWHFRAFSSASSASATGRSQTIACSDEQIVPLSKVWLSTRQRAAYATSAERSTYAGTLPGPTPNAGLPDEYASCTSAEPPVARMSRNRRASSAPACPRARSCVMQVRMSARRAADAAASCTTLIDSATQRTDRGCGDATIPLRDLRQMIALNSAVEVGFVVGMIAATTPNGIRDLHHAGRRVLGDDAARLEPADRGPEPARREAVLRGLAVDAPDAGLLDREAREALGGAVASLDGGVRDAVDLSPGRRS